MGGDSREEQAKEERAKRVKNRAWTTWLTAIVFVSLVCAPIVYRWGRSQSVKAVVATDVALMASGKPRMLKPGTPADVLIPRPTWATYRGGTQFGTSSGNAVIGLSASGSLTSVSSRYREAMEAQGWQMKSRQDNLLAFLFVFPGEPFEADVVFRQTTAETTTIVITLRRM